MFRDSSRTLQLHFTQLIQRTFNNPLYLGSAQVEVAHHKVVLSSEALYPRLDYIRYLKRSLNIQ